MLENLRIIEFAEGVAGPLAALRLSELGAGVVKVEEREGDYMRQAHPKAEGMDDSTAFIELNRGKRSVRLSGSSDEDAKVLVALVEGADVLITDRLDSRLTALGLGPAVAKSERGESNLIVISLSAWGRRGPLADKSGSELTAQAMAGYTRYLGTFGEPSRRLGADVASVATGMFALQAVLGSLYARLRGRSGQRVDLSLCNSLFAMKSIHLAAQSNPDEYKGPRVGGANHPPELGWRTQDGRLFMAFGGSVGPTGRAGWADFVKEIGLENLIDDPRCDETGRSSTGHGAHVHALRSTYDEAFAKYSAEAVVDLIRKHRGNASVYYRLDQALGHEQTRALAVLQQVETSDGRRSVRRFPARFSRFEPRVRAVAPGLGEHTQEVMREFTTNTSGNQ